MFRTIHSRLLKSALTGSFVALTAFGCGDPGAVSREVVDQLNGRLSRLEKTVEERTGDIDERVAAIEKTTRLADLGERREAEAQQKLSEIHGLLGDGEAEFARELIADFRQNYGSTRTGRRASRQLAELEVLGKDAPANYEIAAWYQGEKQVDLEGDKTTLIVFWETWCPHCELEVPKLQTLHDAYSDKGLQVVGLTKQSRGATEDGVREFLDQNEVRYPVAKENGELSRYFAVSGVPAAVAVKDGKVIWRGHPSRLSDSLLESWF